MAGLRSLVEEFLRARVAAKNGDVSPMKTFVNESLGEPWRDELGEIEDFEVLVERRGQYRFGDRWPDERCRFMGVDRQAKGGEHYYYVVRAFGPGGQTRPVTYGRCNSQIELEAIALHHNVPLYRFSSNGVKDLLFAYLTGTFPGWSVPRDIGRDYLKQLSAEHRVEERDVRGHVRYRWHQRHEDNHYLDCELQVMMVGLVTKLVGTLPASGSD